MIKTVKQNRCRWFFLLLVIFILALFFRCYRLNDNPPALNWDEISHGYNAFSILRTGSDEWGQFLPWANFRAYGDYPLPLNLYLTIPTLKFIGLTGLAIRLPHALIGALSVVPAFFLATGLGFGAGTALLTAFLVAVSPWTFFPSRFVVQSNPAVFFLSAGMALWINRERKNWFMPLAFFCFGLSAYSYHNTRILTPLLILAMIFLYSKQLWFWWKNKRQWLLASLAVLLLFYLPLCPVLLSPESRARSTWVGIIDQGAINRIIENRLNSDLPFWLQRLLYNRPVYFLTNLAGNWLSYFRPDFLFFNGGTQYQFSLPGWGVLFSLGLPFFYLGLFFIIRALFKPEKNRLARTEIGLILIWLGLGLLPAALTKGQGHVIRATTVLPLPQLLISFGLVKSIRLFSCRKKILMLIGGLFILAHFVSFWYYWQDYFGDYRRNYSWSWQYGYSKVADYIRSEYDNYEEIWLTKKYGEPHEFMLFYLNWDPLKYRQDSNLVRYQRSNWYWVDSFAKFIFVNDWEVKDKFPVGDKKRLLITSPGNYPAGGQLLKTINFLDDRPAFMILDY